MRPIELSSSLRFRRDETALTLNDAVTAASYILFAIFPSDASAIQLDATVKPGYNDTSYNDT